SSTFLNELQKLQLFLHTANQVFRALLQQLPGRGARALRCGQRDLGCTPFDDVAKTLAEVGRKPMVRHPVVEKIGSRFGAVEEEDLADFTGTVPGGITAACVKQQRRKWKYSLARHQAELAARDLRSCRWQLDAHRLRTHQRVRRAILVVQN